MLPACNRAYYPPFEHRCYNPYLVSQGEVVWRLNNHLTGAMDGELPALPPEQGGGIGYVDGYFVSTFYQLVRIFTSAHPCLDGVQQSLTPARLAVRCLRKNTSLNTQNGTRMVVSRAIALGDTRGSRMDHLHSLKKDLAAAATQHNSAYPIPSCACLWQIAPCRHMPR